MKWKDFDESKKWQYLVLIFVVAFVIRSLDPTQVVITTMLYILIAYMLYDKTDRKERLGLKSTTSKSYLAALIVLGVMVAIIMPLYIITPLCPMHFIDGTLEMAYGLIENVWLMPIVVWLIMGTFWVYAEELFFRGFLNDAMEDLLGIEEVEKKNLTLTKKRIGGITIVSLAFGFCHLSMIWAPLYMWGLIELDLVFAIIAILGLAGIGFAFGILRIKTDSLFPAILCHSLGNFFEVLLISLLLFS